MSATVLTIAAAKEAKIDVIENGRGTQAVHDVVVAMRANRRSGRQTQRPRRKSLIPAKSRGGKKVPAARGRATPVSITNSNC